MSEAHLPDDCRDWPVNPYSLLGVSVNDDMKVVKRAYTRLIKLYKPEHSPKEFQLLRTAFDSIQEGFESRLRFTTPIGEVYDFSADSVAIESSSASNEPSQAQAPEPNLLWEAASQGEFARSLEMMRATSASTTENPRDIGLEYWFANLAEASDDDVEAERKLIQRLLSGNVPYSLCEELRKTLTKQPQLMLDFPLPHAATTTENSYALLNFLELRWEAARRAGRERIIFDDCNELSVALIDRFSTWQEVAYRAVNLLLWSDDQACFEYGDSLVRWLYTNTPVHSYFVYRLESFDTLLEIVPRYRNRASATDPAKPNRLLKLLPMLWNSMRTDGYHEAIDWLATAPSREEALYELDFHR